jgi:hypothetical protein
MLGLIAKDLILIKKKLSVLYVIPIVIIVVATSQNILLMLGILPFAFILIAALQPIQCFEYDENSDWNEALKTLPCSNLEIVGSKYILLAVFLVGATVVMAVVVAVAGMFVETGLSNLFLFCLLGLFASSFYAAIVIPSIYRFGFTKSRYILFIVVALFTAVPLVLQFLNLDTMVILASGNLLNMLNILLGPATILILIASFFASLRIANYNYRM